MKVEPPIQKAHEDGHKVDICGQRSSDRPPSLEFLARAGIDSISLKPDSLIRTKKRIAAFESGE